MAAACSSFGRRAASCLQLGCCRQVSASKLFTFNTGPYSCVALGQSNLAERNGSVGLSIAPCLAYRRRRSNGVQVSYSTGHVICANVRPRAQFLGYSTLAAAGTDGETPAKHVLQVPSLGDSVMEGTVLEWRVGVGSVVQEQDVVCVLETDKVTVDIRADVAGRIESLAVDAGGTVFVGGDLAVIEPFFPKAAAQTTSTPAPSAPSEKASSPAAPGERGSRHAEQAGSSVRDNPTSRRDASTRGHKPLIFFRNALKRLETLGLLPPQRQSVCATERLAQEQKELQQSPRPGSGSVVVRYNGLEDLPPFLLRPALSAEEVEAINEGGLANLDVAAKAWTVSMSFHPVPAGRNPSDALQAKRATA